MTMKWAREIKIMLELVEIRQNIAPAPPGRAEFPPFIVVRRQPAIREHAIDVRAATHSKRLQVGR
jgi:hypothetical protein